MVNESVALLQLIQTKGVGPRSVARVLDVLERDQLSLADFVSMEPAQMVAQFGLKEGVASSVQENQESAMQMADLLDEQNVRIVARTSSAYPPRLKAVLGDKAPPVLFIAGATDLLNRSSLGFSGARDASEEGVRFAEAWAHAAAKQNFLVVSGHAQGVDETAHRAALDAGGQTALVLPEGILNFRPRASLADALTEDNFVVVSEFPPKLPWSVGNAMQRNRTICGLVDALIIVEAGTSGGTWEAGQSALELKVPLFVLDFPDPPASAQGNPLLIRKGGRRLPCHPSESHLAALLNATDADAPSARLSQPSLFDR